MAGVKGRSGRKSNTDEAKRLAIIERSWDIVNEFLLDDATSVDKKVVEAVKIVLRSMPTEPLIKQESHYHFTTVVEELHATAKGKNDTAGKGTRDISSLES